MSLNPVPRLPFEAEGVLARPLDAGAEPERVVVFRLQAFGDVAGVVPVVAALRDRLPRARLDVVTRAPYDELLGAHRDVDAVFVHRAGPGRVSRALALLSLARRMRRPRVDAVVDLQRSRDTRLLTWLLSPRAFAAFDRFAPRHGLDRYLEAAGRALGLEPLPRVLERRVTPDALEAGDALLASRGRDASRRLVCLNPAGGWPTKQWPLERYAELGKRLRAEANAELVLLGDAVVAARLSNLKELLGPPVLDLVGRTNPADVLAILSRASLVVSDDSGLMHVATAQGVPAIALFGASRATWSGAVGPRSAGFYSEDLSCGACLQPVCARGDLLCLDRVTVEDVLAKAREILAA